MAKQKRRKFEPEFKAEAIRLVLEEGRSLNAVAKSLGIYGSGQFWLDRISVNVQRHRKSRPCSDLIAGVLLFCFACSPGTSPGEHVSDSTGQPGDTRGASTGGPGGESTTEGGTTTPIVVTDGEASTHGTESVGTGEAASSGDASVATDTSLSAAEEGSTTSARCQADDDCDNGALCDGDEHCVDGTCLAGTALHCDDGIPCTQDNCDEDAGRCVFSPDDARCARDEVCSDTQGCTSCLVSSCSGLVFQCGNCVDDDGDGNVDMADPKCWGPCDNDEFSWWAPNPGSDPPECAPLECFFDGDLGSSNDTCNWHHRCDPLQPSPCGYDPGYVLPGTGGQACDDVAAAQSDQCLEVCLPLVPNGCDCFGCCEIAVGGDVVTVYLGSGTPNTPNCSIPNAADPSICHPCTQVPACLNLCETCELCLGKDELPAACAPDQQCPGVEQPCGLPGQAMCPDGSFCLTGCCRPNP